MYRLNSLNADIQLIVDCAWENRFCVRKKEHLRWKLIIDAQKCLKTIIRLSRRATWDL